MPRHYILVDFENVQPASLGALKAGDAYIKVFAGQHQTRVELGPGASAADRSARMPNTSRSPAAARTRSISTSRSTSAELAAEHPGATFTIVSRDTGFDPAGEAHGKLGIQCKRVATIPGANVPKLPCAKAEPVRRRGGRRETVKPAKSRKGDEENHESREGGRACRALAGSRRTPEGMKQDGAAHGEDVAFDVEEFLPAVRRRRDRQDAAALQARARSRSPAPGSPTRCPPPEAKRRLSRPRR